MVDRFGVQLSKGDRVRFTWVYVELTGTIEEIVRCRFSPYAKIRKDGDTANPTLLWNRDSKDIVKI